MKKQVWSLSASHWFPTLKQWKQLPRVLHKTEMRLFHGALGIGTLMIFILLGGYLLTHQTRIPRAGGIYTEGVVGEPHLINPLYATSDIDQDLVHLIYSGLFRLNERAEIIPDLAENYTISEDGLRYEITLRTNAYWHHGMPVTAQDAAFTIKRLQDPTYRSPFQSLFKEIQVETPDTSHLIFILPKPSASFLNALTIGILPEDLWQHVDAQNVSLASLNREPVGSGLYRFEKMQVDRYGTIHSYTLEANKEWHQTLPFIEKIIFKFYPDHAQALNALKNKHVEGLGFVPLDMITDVKKEDRIHLYYPKTSRVTVLFFHPKKDSFLGEKTIRQALKAGLNKESLIESQKDLQWEIVHTPLLSGFVGYDPAQKDLYETKESVRLLEEAGFQFEDSTAQIRTRINKETEKTETLSLSLLTSNQPEFLRLAEHIKSQWALLGVEVTIDAVEAETLYENRIRPRDYEVLLTSIQYSTPDPYLFWHSSQVNDPGLNLAGYEQKEVDTYLETARQTMDETKRHELYTQFQTKFMEDIPAIFLYQSTHPYAVTNRVKHISLERLMTPADRFSQIHSWYIKTKKKFTR